MSPTASTEGTGFRVWGFELNQWLLWRQPDSNWSEGLTDAGYWTIRLLTCVREAYSWNHPVVALLRVVLMECGDFAMLREMLLAPAAFGRCDQVGLEGITPL